ncbi:MAG: nodulation protein NfeD [Cyclobacteriaceae bacterium]|nr:nodulation protein NfeD [Cyclobacteriaceae bacterium]
MKLIKSLFSIAIVTLLSLSSVLAQTKVLKLNIDADIDPRMSRYVDLGLTAAKNGGYDLVVIEMDTYGGLVTDAKDIVEMLLDFDKPVYVFINKDAASAGALISIACDSIYMAPGASIGAATVVTGQGEAAPDKYQSYMRATMRTTAEEKGRNPEIAEAMVDQNIEIEGITKAGQVLTFTTSEAIKNGFCEGEYRSVDAILNHTIKGDYELNEFTPSFVEKIVAIFLNPFLSGILIMIIIGGIYFELQTPGVGFPILAAITAAILYFIPYYLTGLAANWELVLFLVGLLLIGLEITVIPGFGVAGIAGIVFTISALVLVMLNNDDFDFTFVPMSEILLAISTTMGALLGSLLIMFFGGVRLTNSKFFERVALTATQQKNEGYTARFHKETMVGKEGTAYTILRPSGKIMIEDNIYDAFTRGTYIDKGDRVKVIGEEGNALLVKKV